MDTYGRNTFRNFPGRRGYDWPPSEYLDDKNFPRSWNDSPTGSHWRRKRPPCGFGATLVCLIIAIMVVLAAFIATVILATRGSVGLVNECATGNHTCSTGCQCVDEIDGFSCTNIDGFMPYDNGTMSCKDIDECKEDNPPDCGELQCVNTPGGYNCGCRQGYTKKDGKCLAVNECTNGQARCAFGSACVDTEEGYDCDCGPGKVFNSKFLTCDDINECDPATPDTFVKCTYGCVNTVGSFECRCLNGYTWNEPAKRCDDIDECENSPCTQNCTNTQGSYECVCGTGYSLIANECVKFTLSSEGSSTATYTAGSKVVFTCVVTTDAPMKVYSFRGDPEVPSLGWADREGFSIPNEALDRHKRYTATDPVATNPAIEKEWKSTLTIEGLDQDDVGTLQCILYHRQKRWTNDYIIEDPET